LMIITVDLKKIIKKFKNGVKNKENT
jgi:hypothetical protein